MTFGRSFREVAAPDGRAFLVGSGGFAKEPGAPFSIVVYPSGLAEAAYLRRPPYVEPVANASTYVRRFDELTDGIRQGTWRPPDVPEDELARLRAQAAKRAARRIEAQEHPVRNVLIATMYMGAVIAFFLVVGAIGDYMSGRAVRYPSPVPLLTFLAAWTAFLAIMRTWGARRLRRFDESS